MFNNHRNSNKAFTPTPSFKNKENWVSGFTLIELLVVVAIIGILSGVVIASLNSAREKGKISSIKSTLKNMQSQAEIAYLNDGNYASLFDGSYNCIGPLLNMAQSLTDKGVTVKCYSHNNSTYGDVYLRFGATAIIYDTNEFKAWSTDQNGVVKWDLKGVNSSGVFVAGSDLPITPWSMAVSACSLSGGRLPSLEELFSLSASYYDASLAATGSGSYTPVGFISNFYWSSNTVPSNDLFAYGVFLMSNRYIHTASKINATSTYVRCVR